MDDLHVYDTEACTWAHVAGASGSPPPKRSYHAMAVIGSKLYVFGGCGEAGRLNDFYVSLAWWLHAPDHHPSCHDTQTGDLLHLCCVPCPHLDSAKCIVCST